MNDRPALPAAIVLALGLLLAGWFVGGGFVRARTKDRFVTVKGVAERIVQSDIGLWPLRFVGTSNDLGAAQSRVESQRRAVMAFLRRFGIDSTQTDLQGLEVQDVLANPYRGTGPIGDRFIVTMLLMVRSDQPARIREASQRVGDLVNAGVVLSSGPGGGPFGGPTYVFTRLNELKPAMIAEATASARQAAEQFAKDSKSHLGAIRRASQGIFEILPRDQAAGVMQEGQLEKTLRVVSTVEYYLD